MTAASSATTPLSGATAMAAPRASRPIRAGLLGCGAVALRGLIPGWMAPDDPRRPTPAPFLDFGGSVGLEIVAICDPEPPRLATVQGVLPAAQRYLRAELLLADSERLGLEVALIATPNHLHAPLTLAALDAGLDVFVEKPLATSHAELDEVCRRTVASGRLVMVDLPWRFHRVAATLRAALASRLVGEVTSAQAEFRHAGPESWSPDATWYRAPSNRGGCLLDLGPHVLDLLLDVFGRARPERCKIWGALDGNGVCVRAVGHPQFPGNTHGAFLVGWDAPTPVFRLFVTGTRGTLRAELTGPRRGVWHSNEVVLMAPPGHRDGSAGDDRPVRWAALASSPGAPDLHEPDLDGGPFRHFVSCLQDRREPITSPAHVALAERLLLDGCNDLAALAGCSA